MHPGQIDIKPKRYAEKVKKQLRNVEKKDDSSSFSESDYGSEIDDSLSNESDDELTKFEKRLEKLIKTQEFGILKLGGCQC